MPVPRSRISTFLTPHVVSVVRKVDRETRDKGRIVSDCDWVVLYETVRGRIGELREFIENIQKPVGFGNDSADIFRGYLVFPELPVQLRRSDFIRIPWGTKPNYFLPMGVPFAPSIILNTPGGPVTLTWNGTEYSGEGYTMDQLEDAWCLSGDDLPEPHCFETANPLCEEFPDGFSFVKLTGPYQYYELLRFENQLDDFGHYHHTRVEIEFRDPKV